MIEIRIPCHEQATLRGQPAKAYNQPGWEKKFVDWIAREIDQMEARLR